MIRLETIEFIQNIIAYLVAYFPSIALAGYFESWIAKKFGDDTPEEMGYLTLNPITHMDPIGIAILMLPPHFGFGARIPVNLNNINKPFKNLKLFLIFFARCIAHLLLTIVFLFFLLFLQNKILPNFNFTDLNLKNLSPVFLAFTLMFHAFLNLNILSSVMYFLIGFIRFFIHFFMPDLENRSSFMNLLVFIFPFLLIIVLGPYVEYLIRVFLIKVNFLFGYLLK